MQYTYEEYKYNAAELQAKTLKTQGNRHHENRGKQDRRRR